MKSMKNCIAIFFALFAAAVHAQTAVYTSNTSFFSAVNETITDNYTSAGYYANPYTPFENVFTDAQMDAVFGQTRYTTTGWLNQDLIGFAPSSAFATQNYYCAGCNGSYTMDFTHTTLSGSGGSGVYGVGFEYENLGNSIPYVAFVTFGNNTTSNETLAYSPGSFTPYYFGITSSLGIKSIAIGLENGGTTTDGQGGFLQTALTIASVPEPSTLALTLAGLVLVSVAARQVSRQR